MFESPAPFSDKIRAAPRGGMVTSRGSPPLPGRGPKGAVGTSVAHISTAAAQYGHTHTHVGLWREMGPLTNNSPLSEQPEVIGTEGSTFQIPEWACVKTTPRLPPGPVHLPHHGRTLSPIKSLLS